MNDAATPDPELPGELEPGSLGENLRALAEDGQVLVEAEIAYRKAQAAYGWSHAKGIAALLTLALAFGFFTLVALVVGLLLALTPWIGAWGALAVVGIGLGVLSGLCFAMAVSRFRLARSAIIGAEGTA